MQERATSAWRGWRERLGAAGQGRAAEIPPPERSFVASTVVALPVDPEAATLVKAAFEAARLDYGPATIGDLRDGGAGKCEACSDILGSSKVGGVRCDASS